MQFLATKVETKLHAQVNQAERYSRLQRSVSIAPPSNALSAQNSHWGAHEFCKDVTDGTLRNFPAKIEHFLGSLEALRAEGTLLDRRL